MRSSPQRILITGVAGFIGSHLAEALLGLGQSIIGFDNLQTGSRDNLKDLLGRVGDNASRFRFIEGDLRDYHALSDATQGINLVLHQAALASVPRSMEFPMDTHSANVTGFVNLLVAAEKAGVQRIVYASSSSVYGDETSQPKTESRIGRPLSPYAASKRVDEIYAATFKQSQRLRSVGLRYFNVFGPRQNPLGPYSAVIPRWVENLLKGEPCVVFGDGSASRDFCFIENVVQANLLAACAPEEALRHDVFNVACGSRTTLLELFSVIRAGVTAYRPDAEHAVLSFKAPRQGDVLHSLASVDRAREELGYQPSHDLRGGMNKTIGWYAQGLASEGLAGEGLAGEALASEARVVGAQAVA
ncbi:MAG TPA: NAD-dependent epimerase/dehydratase family protein [Polyangiaceae bacterium]|nr:NAD-dependent epimerase/dehydratase family protein [Polyangiaceae bacterium]